MGALIILHGLFLLHCNAKNTAIDSLKPQTCEILSAESPGHYYRVGSNKLVELRFSTNLTVNLGSSVNKDPDTKNLASRLMVLDSSVIVRSDLASLKIIVPMPDNIYGANVLRVFREDVLNKTDSGALRSQAGSDKRIALAESIVLSYDSGKSFSLYDGNQPVKGADSAPFGKNHVLAFFSWPAMQGMPCTEMMNHVPLNKLLRVNGQEPTFQLMGLGPSASLDDPDVAAFNLTDQILRPPCVTDSKVKFKKGSKVKTRNLVRNLFDTATETGCGPQVHIEY